MTDYVHQGIKEDDVTKLRYLTSDERVNYIIQRQITMDIQVKFYKD